MRVSGFEAELSSFRRRFPQGDGAYLNGPGLRRRAAAGTGCAQALADFQSVPSYTCRGHGTWQLKGFYEVPFSARRELGSKGNRPEQLP